MLRFLNDKANYIFESDSCYNELGRIEECNIN